MEGAIAMQTGVLWDLSKQNLVDCETTSYGCEGGFIDTAFQYGIDEGINLEENYPYTMAEYQSGDDIRKTCSKSGPEKFISSYDHTSISRYDEEALTNHIYSNGPIAVAIDAGNRAFSYYKRGIHYDESCGYKPRSLNHAVLAVGYGTNNKGDYYIVKNSWGTGWGKGGYILMARNQNNNCGIATDCSFAIA